MEGVIPTRTATLTTGIMTTTMMTGQGFLMQQPTLWSDSFCLLCLFGRSFVHCSFFIRSFSLFVRLFVHLFERSFVFVRSFVRSFVHLFIHSSVHSFICSFAQFVRSFVCSLIRLSICSFVRLFVHSFISSFVHSFISVIVVVRSCIYPSSLSSVFCQRHHHLRHAAIVESLPLPPLWSPRHCLPRRC
jgi:hypothetical protein